MMEGDIVEYTGNESTYTKGRYYSIQKLASTVKGYELVGDDGCTFIVSKKDTKLVILTEDIRQQICTRDFLRTLKAHTKAKQWKALVAGGAPRDWEQAQPANDIDIWCKAPRERIKDFRNLIMETGVRLYNSNIEVKLLTPKDYPTGEGYIEYIYSVYMCRMDFQLIFVTDNSPKAVIDHVCCNLSEIWWDWENDMLYPTPAYKSGREHKHLVFKKDAGKSPRQNYIKKMCLRYPDYTVDISKAGDHLCLPIPSQMPTF